jgi:hypothetical protein
VKTSARRRAAPPGAARTHGFEELKLRKLITTCYKNRTPPSSASTLFCEHTGERGKCLVHAGDKQGARKPGRDFRSLTLVA